MANYYVAVNPTSTGLNFTSTLPSSTVIPSMSFINLKDCPNSYTGAYGKILMVAGTGGISFVSATFAYPGNSSIIPYQTGLISGMGFELKNDLPNPGANKYYGTNSAGVKGWYDLP
jgi:hypothetical protein